MSQQSIESSSESSCNSDDAPSAAESSSSTSNAPAGNRLRAIVSNETPRSNTPPGADEHDITRRLRRLELQNRWLKLSVSVTLILAVFYVGKALLPPNTIVQQTLMESKELKLLDNDGNPRLFLRMYSRVPVLQLLDKGGKPRMSLGLRFDDTPFLDFSDQTGETRVSVELNGKGEPLIELFDAKGDSTTRIR